MTGCTDGIGKAYIEELAEARGVKKFYLIARNEKKLNQFVQELSKILISNIIINNSFQKIVTIVR